MTPSVKTLETGLNIDRSTALRARKLMEGHLDPESFDSVDRWVRQCYHRPNQNELIMAALDELLGGFGVECIREDCDDSPAADYINQGDSYNTTILYCHIRDRFIVACWGDYIEWLERRNGEQIQ